MVTDGGIEETPVSICSGAREFEDGITLIQECNPKPALVDEYEETDPSWYTQGAVPHMQQNAYLLMDEKTLLFDTTSPANRDELIPTVQTTLNGRSLDYIVGSHPEAPHAGNAFALMEAFPEAEFVAPAYDETNELYHMDTAKQVEPGDTIDLGSRTVEFVEPIFLDHRVHIWMRDNKTNTLFTVDWLGMLHTEGECLQCTDEFDKPVTVRRLAAFHKRALFWLAYADTEAVNTAIDELLESFEPETIAPSHGNPVRKEAAKTAQLMKDVTDRVSQDEANEVW